MALAPWPRTGTQALTKAIAMLRSVARIADDETAARLGAVAAAMVEDYAPDAPQPLKDEAVIRLCGYLSQAGSGAVPSHNIGTVISQEYITNHANAWRNCGAGMLLSRWRVRRAGSIG